MSTSLLCNPVDLPYRFQEFTLGPFRRFVVREGADPSVIFFEGRFYLFVSMSGGFWHSPDARDWEFVETPTLPVYDYAPDVRIVDDYLVVCASHRTKLGNFFRTKDPLGGEWEVIPGTFTFWDPNLFQDDDGRLFFYWGCSNKTPIEGVELDRTTFHQIGKPVVVIDSDTTTRGWERTGVDYDPANHNRPFWMKSLVSDAPFIEGAWMTKHNGTYYLQYAAPGTEYHTYADGYFTSASPLGPFEYSPHSPFSLKPGGYLPSAGHGSTFQDTHGNWWHAATMRISKGFMFERRVGIFPAGFDDDGVLFCNQEFADYPYAMPQGRVDPWSITGKTMLLNAGARVTASSSEVDHGPELAVNEDVQTWWVAGAAKPGEWLQTEVAEGASVEAIQVNLAEHNIKPTQKRSRDETEKFLVLRRHISLEEPAAEFTLEASLDGETWDTLHDTRGSAESRSHVLITLPEPKAYRYVRVTGFAQPYGAKFAVSGLRVFGLGSGSTPAAATATARRTGPLNALVSWDRVPGAHGYNVRYGITADKLYSCWQVGDVDSLDVGSLNAGQPYFFAVDAFNENGVTRGAPVSSGVAPLS